MKRKGVLLLFFTSWVPGCGQMYQGYMKRGLSLMLACCLLLFFPAILRIDALVVFLAPAWLYAFFDSYNLRNLSGQGLAPQDDWLFGLSAMDTQKLAALCRGRHSLIGWVLVVLGVYALFDTVVGRALSAFCEQTGNWWIYNTVMRDLPRLVVTLGIIALGIWFIRGPKQPKGAEIPVFTPPVAESVDVPDNEIAAQPAAHATPETAEVEERLHGEEMPGAEAAEQEDHHGEN